MKLEVIHFYNTHFQNLKINLITLTYYQIKFNDAKFHLSTAKKLLIFIIDDKISDNKKVF